MLPINISGHQVELTPPLKDYVNKKFNRLEKRLTHSVTGIHIVFEVEKAMQKVKATFHLPGKDIIVGAESADAYKSVDLLMDKANIVLNKRKGKLQDYHKDDKLIAEHNHE